MNQTKIRGFKDFRDGKEDFTEYLKDIKWIYEQNYENRIPVEKKTKTQYYNKMYRILFKQYLKDYTFI